MTSGRRAGLGGHDQRLAVGLGEQPAQDALGLAPGVAVGRVDERAARVPEVGELQSGVDLVGVPAPRHGAQGQARDDETAAAELTLLHGPRGYRVPRRYDESPHPHLTYMVGTGS